MHKIIDPKDISKSVYTTYDNINAYKIEDVYFNILEEKTIVDAVVYTASGDILNSCLNGRLVFNKQLQEVCLPGNENVIELDSACVLIRIWGYNYFHLFLELFDKILIAEELGFKGKYILLYSKDMEALLHLADINSERIIWIERGDVDCKGFHIKEAFEVEGFHVHLKRTISRLSNWCEKIAEKISNNRNSDYPKKIYVLRKGKRKLLEVDDILKKFGFYTFIPEEHTL